MDISILTVAGCAFLGGLILNVMPCVFPVISLKILNFLKMAGEKKSIVIKHGLSYSTGVCLSFVSLAGMILITQFLGGLVGWGFQFQSPWFCWSMAAILACMGLKSMGVLNTLWVKIKSLIPSNMSCMDSIRTFIDSVKKRYPYWGSFTQGILTVILGSACCGPMIGYAIGMSFLFSWPITLLMFLLMGLGMALPYLVFSLFPTWTKFLPRSGNWLLWTNKVLGAIMILSAGWFIWIGV